MSSNPYTTAIGRYFQIVLGVLGGLSGIGLAGYSLLIGHAPQIGRRSTGPGYVASGDPSHFWFTVLFYAAFGLIFLHVAWRAYRR